MDVFKLISEHSKDRGQENFKKEDYKISNTTHLIAVSTALSLFPNINKIIIGYSNKIDSNIQEESNKIKTVNKLTQIQNLMAMEKYNKNEIISLLNKEIINNDNFESELKKLIKSQDDGMKYAQALGIIDDYIEYLETGIYNGPSNKIN